MAALLLLGAEIADIRSVEPDLTVPPVADGEPKPGSRVFVTDETSGVPFAVWLPADWKPGQRYPVILELPGNGGFRSPQGDTCTGRPEDCKLGYGITGGKGAVWIAVPFLDATGKSIALTWWGDRPEHTAQLIRRVADWACREAIGGNRERLFLAGFSRGAIACNVIGLHDDSTAKLWRGMICYSHYDGVRESWPFAGSDRTSAAGRLARLGDTPQFVCHESGGGIAGARDYLARSGTKATLTFAETGFRNHSDAWVLRPSPARDRLREWFATLSASAER